MEKSKLSLILVSLILGIMIAIQFNSINNETTVRDTRNQWELREAIMKEKEIQSRLLNEIRTSEEKLAQYETEWKQSKEQALLETLEQLKYDAGLAKVTGPGLIIYIEPLFNNYFPDGEIPFISPDLLQKLINELNMYGAKQIAVANQRVVNTTVIRDINGDTKIDGLSLKHYPLEIKVTAEDDQATEKLYNRMLVSQSIESLFIDNLKVEIVKPKKNIEIPAYSGVISTRGMKPVKIDKGGNS